MICGAMVSGSYFAMLGVKAATGRLLRQVTTGRTPPVAVISHGYWQRQFAGDRRPSAARYGSPGTPSRSSAWPGPASRGSAAGGPATTLVRSNSTTCQTPQSSAAQGGAACSGNDCAAAAGDEHRAGAGGW